jgi:multimeric flavodoxin WrbA
MKLLGISCGRRMGNSEILLREALMGAAELGVETEIITLLDFDIKPCLGCKVCPAEIIGKEACIIKDDAVFFWNKVMDCDGLIISGPVYCLTPPGYLLLIRDRLFGSKSDVAWMSERKKLKAQGEKVFVDERCFKTRPGAFISVGGSITPDWLSLGLSIFQTMTFSIQLEVVDQMMVMGTNIVEGQVLLNNAAISRAHQMGRNVAGVMGKPASKMKWKGDEMGTCPVCHQNEITIKDKNPVQCSICGIYGELKIENGKITVTFSEAEQKRSRLTFAGKMEHWDEYHPHDPEKAWASEQTSTMPPSKQKQFRDEIKRKMAKYQADKPCIKPPKMKNK